MASSIRSSHKTESPSRTTCFVDSNLNTSEWNRVVVMLSRNLSCFPRSTWSCLSCVVARSPPEELGWCAFSQGLMMVMGCLGACYSYCFELLGWLCQPKTSELGHGASSIALPPKLLGSNWGCAPRCPSSCTVGNAGVFDMPQLCRVAWLWRMSLDENLIHDGSALQRSVQVIFEVPHAPHLVQGPCLYMPSILLQPSSSTSAHTSSRTSWYTSSNVLICVSVHIFQIHNIYWF